MPVDLEKMTNDDFDRLLIEVAKEESVESLIRIPGVYEVLRDHFNNDVLARWEQEEEARLSEEYEQKYAWTPTDEDLEALDGIADDLYHESVAATCPGCPVEDDCPFDQDLDCKHLFDACIKKMRRVEVKISLRHPGTETLEQDADVTPGMTARLFFVECLGGFLCKIEDVNERELTVILLEPAPAHPSGDTVTLDRTIFKVERVSDPVADLPWADNLLTPLKPGQKIRLYPGGGSKGYLCEVTDPPTSCELPVRLLEPSGKKPAGSVWRVWPGIYKVEMVE